MQSKRGMWADDAWDAQPMMAVEGARIGCASF